MNDCITSKGEPEQNPTWFNRQGR